MKQVVLCSCLPDLQSSGGPNRELKVRVDGQLVFNGATQMLNAALAGLGLAFVAEDPACRSSMRSGTGPP